MKPVATNLKTEYGYKARIQSLEPLSEETRKAVVDFIDSTFVDHHSPALYIAYNHIESMDLFLNPSLIQVDIWAEPKLLPSVEVIESLRATMRDPNWKRTNYGL